MITWLNQENLNNLILLTMKNFFILVGICIIACSADSIVSSHPDDHASFVRVSDAIASVDSLDLQYEDVTDENISAAILQAADHYDLSDVELQAVVDNYAD
jgi:hypothetical protein